jgi:hypothetical protein
MEPLTMDKQKHVYEKTGERYLEQIMAMPWDRLETTYGLDTRDRMIRVPFFRSLVHINKNGFFFATGEKTPFDVCVIAARYVLMCPETLPAGKELSAFRDFKGSGPLTVFYADNVEVKIRKNIHDPARNLKHACLELGGYRPDASISRDAVMTFDALPHLPVYLLYDFADEEFPSSCSVLFESRAQTMLDPESLAIIGAVLAQKLVALSKSFH